MAELDNEPAMAPPTRSLHRKLAQIMWEAERIPKRGKAPAVMGGYPFVQVGDAADFIRKALGEHVLSMLPTAVRIVGQVDRETAKGGNMTTVDLITTWTITDGESGESVSFESFGAGADGGDKYSGKASTSAMKYALLTGFLLSTGDDTEAFATPEQRSERNPRVGAADHEPEPMKTNGGLIGNAEKGEARTTDFLVRQSPDGAFLGFRLIDGRTKSGQIIEVYGPMAEALAALDVIGTRLQVWGHFVKRDLPKGGSYQAFVAEKIQTPEWTLPAPEAESPAIVVEPAVQEAPAEPPVAADVAEGGTDEPPVSAPPGAAVDGRCGNASPFGDGGSCGLPAGHGAKLHRELEADGKVVGSWPTT